MNAAMSLEKTKHHPVMLKQVLSIISPQHGGTFIDCTFGGGGYSKSILKYPNTKVIAIDRDKKVLEHAKSIKKKFPDRFDFYLNKFSNLDKIINSEIKPKAIIFDLGLSSFQLSDDERGFSFNSNGFLSMEMGINKYSAYNAVNLLDKKQLSKIIKTFGDEKDARRIAYNIIKHRKKNFIKTSNELASIINDAKIKKNYKKNPSTKTFQALRIFVNRELTELILGLICASKLLSKGGKLIVVSFHSLEDQIVKIFFSLYSNFKKNPSRYLPLNENKLEMFNLLSKKAFIPDQSEINSNIRSRSAKLRYGTRNNNDFFNPDEFIKKFNDYFEIDAIKI